jgi:hypothetical protein
MDSARLQPALFGGLFIGVLSALPFVSAGNCCCCLWVIAGGVLATYLRQQNSPFALQASEGALMGLMAGFLGGILAAVISVPVQMVFGPMQAEWMMRMFEGNQDMPPEMRDAMERMASNMGAFALATAVFNVVVYTVFGLLGGLLGVAIFKKSAPPPPPPGTVEVLPPE